MMKKSSGVGSASNVTSIAVNSLRRGRDESRRARARPLGKCVLWMTRRAMGIKEPAIGRGREG